MKQTFYLFSALIILAFLPACLGTKSLKGEKIKKFQVKIENESKICPNNPFNIEVKVTLANGDVISTADFVGGVAWGDLVVDVKNGRFQPHYTKGFVTANEKLTPEGDAFLDLNIYSKYHKNMPFKRHIKLRYDCKYLLDIKGKNGDSARGKNGNGLNGQNGKNVTVKIQKLENEGIPVLQVLVKYDNIEKKYLVSTASEEFLIDARGGNGGNGADSSRDGINAGNGGNGGGPGHVTYIFSPKSIAYKSIFKANVNGGQGGRAGKARGKNARNGRSGKDGETFFKSHVEVQNGKKVNVITPGFGTVDYETQELPDSLW